jgi:hypothetical protein
MKGLFLLVAVVLVSSSVVAKKTQDVVAEKAKFSVIMKPELSRTDQKKMFVVDVEVIQGECDYRPNKFGLHSTFSVKEIGGKTLTYDDCFVSKKNDKDNIRYTLKVGDKIRLTGKVYVGNYQMMMKIPTFEIYKIEKL